MADSDEYPFQLIKFIAASKSNKLLAVDIVPSSWISFDNNIGQCVTKFMPPPYSAKSVAQLHTLVKNCSQPLNTWSTYPVELRGHAKSYEEAVKRCEELHTKPYAYTSNADMRSEEKAKMMEQSYRCKKNKIDKMVTKTLVNVPNLVDHQSNDDSNCSSVIPPTPNTESDRSTDESLTMRSKSQRKKKQRNSKPNAAYKSTHCTLTPNTESDRSTDESLTMRSKSQRKEKQGNSTPSATYKSTDCNRNYSGVPSQAISATPKFSRSKLPNQFPKKSGITKGMSDVISNTNSPSHDTSELKQSILLQDLEPAMSVASCASLDSCSQNNHPPAPGKQNPRETPHGVDNYIRRSLEGLAADIKELTKEVRSLRTVVEAINLGNNDMVVLPEQHDIAIPVRSLELFKDFDGKLGDKENPGFRNKFARSLYFYIDRDGVLSRSIRSMLRHYLSREVILLFTALKETPGKHIFKKTNFCQIMIEVLNAQGAKNNKSPIKNTVFYQQLGNVISNAKDWDSNRRARNKPKDAIPEADDAPGAP